MKLGIFTLSCTETKGDESGHTKIVCTSVDKKEIFERLCEIIATQGKEFIGSNEFDRINCQIIPHADWVIVGYKMQCYSLQFEISHETRPDLTLLFQIHSSSLDVPGEVKMNLVDEIQKKDFTEDFEKALSEAVENGEIFPAIREYCVGNPNVTDAAWSLYQEKQDCNVCYNDLIADVVSKITKGISLDRKVLAYLLRKFQSLPVDSFGQIKEEFLGFPVKTNLCCIRSWFVSAGAFEPERS